MDAFSDGGSTPPASTKQKDTPNGVSFCLGAIGSFQCLAEINSACAKVFAWGENLGAKAPPHCVGPQVLPASILFRCYKKKDICF